MSDDSGSAGYHRKLQELAANVQSAIDAAGTANQTSLRALIGTLALSSWLLYAATSNRVPVWSFLVPIPFAYGAGRWHGKNRDKWLRLLRLQKLYERAIARMEDRWYGIGFTGEEFRADHHVSAADLQLTGTGSLFELLCTVRTGIGRKCLANYLLYPRGVRESAARQSAVRELLPRDEIREHIGLLGKFDFQESTWEAFSAWTAMPAAVVSAWVRIPAAMSSVGLFLLVLAGFSSNLPWNLLVRLAAPLFAILMGIAWYFRTRTNPLNAAASRVGIEIGVVREGIDYVTSLTLESEKLAAIQQRLILARAGPALRSLERLTNALTQCAKPHFDLPSQAIALRTQTCFAIEAWKRRHGAHLEEWLAAWGEFEALAALSGYAREHPDDVFPVFTEGEASFAARDLGHPLIPAGACVSNDVELNSDNRFFVISGSNMAGKSTLLRSIGLSVVLANAGAPVRATSLRLTELDLFASLSIVDSILEGKSKFLAEVDRIRRMLEHADQNKVLFLIDEILSGTNSRDRRVASEAVVRALVERGAIGALSTHDLALTEIARIPILNGSNVHMGARPGGGPLDFDYLLKPGVTEETNAMAIIEMMGVLRR